ncbi:hypothetical protein ESA_04381 [Cronobacter sakazakii ATCC BAA-894]|uniref:Uncharacterized protein n=1 Tax=Cronobacter sakazakii (strain ATCC BAA-894) TaxID=290339 RepID=A7MKJ8_CROS8|nr:hypothetical protein ESA_04381 [Cronobacter sakazakii ATCC BAA-894]
MDKSVGVRTVQAAFQTVKHHQTRFMTRLVRVFAKRQVNKIAVRQIQTLPVRLKLQTAAQHARQHGLQVWIADSRHWLKV